MKLDPPTMVGVHLQVRLGLFKNLKRKYGVDPPTMMAGDQIHLLTSGKVIFFRQNPKIRR